MHMHLYNIYIEYLSMNQSPAVANVAQRLLPADVDASALGAAECGAK